MVFLNRGSFRISPVWWGYRTPREVIVADGKLCGFYWSLKILVYYLVINDLYNQNGWAYSEAPGATYNVWAEETDGFWAAINNHSSYADGLEYCSNPAYDFHYSSTWIYTTPECRAMAPEQVVRKLDGLLFIMTAFLETVEEGWNCTDPGASTCAAPNTLRELRTGQCVCEHPTKAVYPLAVEELAIKFEHSFKTHASFNDLWRELKGSSSDPVRAVARARS